MPGFKKTTLSVMEVGQVPDGMPLAFDDNTLAFHIGIKTRTLWLMVMGSGLQAGQKGSSYRLGEIPKRGRAGQRGEKRKLHIPADKLKAVQRALCAAFVQPLPVGPQVKAYEPGSSVVGTAQDMSGGGVLISMDLKNFFGSIRMSWVRSFFMSKGYNRQVSSLLARLCCCRDEGVNFLPQGTPVSPGLANRIAQDRVDGAVLDICKEYGWSYVRYSDNVYFSHPEVVPVDKTNEFKDKVASAFRRGGWATHKILVLPKWRRQKVLGLTVNDKPNVQREQYAALRALIHNCMVEGFESQVEMSKAKINPGINCAEDLIAHIRGKLSYFGQVLEPSRQERLSQEFETALETERLSLRQKWEEQDKEDSL